jgi:DNA polymerase I-like protein with 3'-5' exonuclease and polymerase domains
MLFDMPHIDRQAQTAEVLRRQQCTVCPLKKFKKPDAPVPDKADILILSKPLWIRFTEKTTKVPTHHAWMIECTDPKTFAADSAEKNKISQSTIECCLGRKLDLIRKLKPKVVLAIGYEVFKKIEQAQGHTSHGDQHYIMFPSELDGHQFWLISVPDYNTEEIEREVMNVLPTLQRGLHTEPTVYKGNGFEGVECIVKTSELDAVFRDLRQNKQNAIDFEANTLRPYGKRVGKTWVPARLLSMAIGTFDRTFSFPMYHVQRPSSFDPKALLEHVRELIRSGNRLIAHHLELELEWLAYILGGSITMAGQYDDTEAQAYLIAGGQPIPKSLDALVRRYFGLDLKALSNIDRKQIEKYPLEKILRYNGGDTKWTEGLWNVQDKIVRSGKLDNMLYRVGGHVDRICATTLMQLNGIQPNNEAIEELTKLHKDPAMLYRKQFGQFDEIKRFQHLTQSEFNPASTPDILKLYKMNFWLPESETSTAGTVLDEVMDALPPDEPGHQITKLILDTRSESKIYGTTLAPLNPHDDHKNAGNAIWPDGLIHTNFNTLKTKTSRTSSDSPNMQNYPKDKIGTRNVIKVSGANHILVAIDYGQVEYRMIAGISGDAEMIRAILNGLDVHMYWAQELDKAFPGMFIKNPIPTCIKTDTNPECSCYKCQLKDFRQRCKSFWTFALCFGASVKKVAAGLGIPEHKKALLSKMIKDDFWGHHNGVKKWHDSLERDLQKKGYIINGVGRQLNGPLSHNQKLNFPIQSTASDIVIIAMSRLARMSVELNMPWLCPILNVHDDLSFSIPEEHFVEALDIILRIMLDMKPYPWLPVPLLAEVSTGYLWGNMKKFGEFSSADIAA